MRLTTKDIKPLREKLLRAQGNVCPLCGKHIKKEEAALDHCHTTGHVRQVLHKNCNSVEGRILHWAKRIDKDKPHEVVQNLVWYWQRSYTSNPIHPRHKTEKEKKILKLKRQARRCKTERGKQRNKDAIKRLMES